MINSDFEFDNSWDDQVRAQSYSRLKFPNTYYLAYRDLPEIITKHVKGKRALDFGCGAGRSTRFLKKHGFNVTGIDIASDMLKIAVEIDPTGDYQLVSDGNYSHLGDKQFDVILSAFTFDNIPRWENRSCILKGLHKLLKQSGRMILLDSTPELYVNEWASFTTKDFKENFYAVTGDIVRTIMLDVPDRRPVNDIYWTIEDYQKLFRLADLEIEATYKPLGCDEDPYDWISERNIAPWMIFVLKK